MLHQPKQVKMEKGYLRSHIIVTEVHYYSEYLTLFGSSGECRRLGTKHFLVRRVCGFVLNTTPLRTDPAS